MKMLLSINRLVKTILAATPSRTISLSAPGSFPYLGKLPIPVVRVKVPVIEAESQIEAINKAGKKANAA